MSLIPSKKQWKGWTLPSKAGYLSLVLAIITGILAVLFFLWPSDAEKEVDADSRHAEQEEMANLRHAEDIKIAQEREERLEALAKKRHAEMKQTLNELMEELVDENEKLEDYLRKQYRFGYVLFSRKNGINASLPKSYGGLEVFANWQRTEIVLFPDENFAAILIPDVKWEQYKPHMTLIESNAVSWKGKYNIREPVFISHVKIEGQPGMFFEVIRDDATSWLCVVGFRLFDHDKTPFPSK